MSEFFDQFVSPFEVSIACIKSDQILEEADPEGYIRSHIDILLASESELFLERFQAAHLMLGQILFGDFMHETQLAPFGRVITADRQNAIFADGKDWRCSLHDCELGIDDEILVGLIFVRE